MYHDDTVLEFLALEDQGFEVDRPIAAQPENDCSAFMVNAQFHGSHSILPRFGKWYTVSVEDDLRIDKDTADLAGRSAVSLFYYLLRNQYQVNPALPVLEPFC